MIQKTQIRGGFLPEWTSLFFVTVKETIFKGGSVWLHTHIPSPDKSILFNSFKKIPAILRSDMSHPILQLDFLNYSDTVSLCARLTTDKMDKYITIVLKEGINPNVL